VKLELRYKHSFDTDIVNHHFFHYTGAAPGNGGLATWLNGVHTAWVSYLKPITTGAVVLQELHAIDLSSAAAGTADLAVSEAGGYGGLELPAGIAALINYKVQRRYRGGKPRTYAPLGKSTDVADGQDWVEASRASFESGYTNFLVTAKASSMGSATIDNIVNISYYEGFTTFTTPSGRVKNISTPRATPLVDVILTITCNGRYGSQRRRNRP
jgi:hypothetical protein